MNRAEEIKVYNTKEEIENDFNDFRPRWRYDADRSAGVHETGLGMRKVQAMGGMKLMLSGLQEWTQDMEDVGLDQTQIEAYRRMLQNQFVILTEKEPPLEHEMTLEERVKSMEENDKRKIEMLRRSPDCWLSEEQIRQVEEDLRLSREKMLREGGWHGGGSDR